MSKLLDDVGTSLRLKRYAYSTEQSYIHWMLRFILFHNKRHPREMGAVEIGKFLTHLADKKHVSASTQNQALQAILYLYKFLGIDVGNVNFARARREVHLPALLTREEVTRLMTSISDAQHRLMAMLCYSGGLRLNECLALRIKDIDLDNLRATLRETKSNTDRYTIISSKLVEPLKAQIAKSKSVYESDVKAKTVGVYLPDALERKYPNAAREFAWFWLFPSPNLSKDPRSGMIRRHHMHETGLQKAIVVARKKAKITKPASVHVLRHCFATHFLERGGNINDLKGMMGHKDLKTTMIYLHGVEISGKNIKSPLDD